jgi:hypothetical protein
MTLIDPARAALGRRLGELLKDGVFDAALASLRERYYALFLRIESTDEELRRAWALAQSVLQLKYDFDGLVEEGIAEDKVKQAAEERQNRANRPR